MPFFSRKTKTIPITLVIHGGAGTMSRDSSTPEQREAYRETLRISLQAGYKVLQNGGEAMDAAVEAVRIMEDSPLFNAGKGAVFNVAGKNELEASIMLSKPPSIPSPSTEEPIPESRRGLGLTLLRHTRNPSLLVRELYMNPSIAPHPFLSDNEPERLGKVEFGIEPVDPSYFWTEHRWKEHMSKVEPGEGLPAYADIVQDTEKYAESKPDFPLDLAPKGTVGAVALDIRGCIASCTSTGGRTNKLVGRIGDTPIFGCGFWAAESPSKTTFLRYLLRKPLKKKAIGVSGTGDGDYFIRQNTASTLSHHVLSGRHRSNLDIESQRAVDRLRKDGGDGGVIVVDEKGRWSMKMNCPGMYRGVMSNRPGEEMARVAIFADDVLS
ncbi:asparaginase [Flagelloscypha sp. PMI_526]|nr:asparaginase [Flagelloscypha sp. PMI_526]